MRYSVLAETYEELQRVSSKLKKTEIVAKLLKETPTNLLPKVVLLITGTVFPSWSGEEIGIANQLIIKAITKATGSNENEVVTKFKKTGDLGSAVEELQKKQRSLAKYELTIDKVFDNLVSIARQSGSGSQERKLNILIELVTHASPAEAKYIIRTVLWQLRVGVAEGILRDAIAEAFNVSPESVEQAWFLLQDYGEVARIANEDGESGLKNVKIHIGNPVFVQLAEKSPTLKEAIESFDKTAIEKKYDGARAEIHKKGSKFWIYTRRMENITNAFPDLIELCKRAIKADDCIVEGEILAISPKTGKPLPFQRLSQRIKRKHEIEKTIKDIPIQFNAFDILYLNGKQLFDKNLEERRRILTTVIKPILGKIKLAEQLVTKNLNEAEGFYKQSLKEGQEGVMVKNLSAKYVPGRRVEGGWLKVKPTLETLDLAIVGGTWGTGKRAGWLGSLMLGCRDPNTGKFLECGMLGTGVKEKESEGGVTFEELTKLLKQNIISEQMHEVKVKPKVVIEVAYEEIQKSQTYSSGYALRFPRLVRIRYDKGPDQADDLDRVKKIFSMQKGKR